MKRSSIAALLVLTAAWGVSAAAEDGEAQKPKKEKLICKTEGVTGSLTRKRRTCMTAEQWDQIASAARKNMGDLDRSYSSIGSPGNSGNPYGGS